MIELIYVGVMRGFVFSLEAATSAWRGSSGPASPATSH